MNDRVGRSAQRSIDDDGVLKRLPCHDLRHREPLVHHVHNPPTSEVSHRESPRVNSRDCSTAGRLESQRFNDGGHRRRGAHRHAVAGASGHARFCFVEVVGRHATGAVLFGELPDVSSGADVSASELTVEHWAASNHQGGKINARCPHGKPRGCFVATGEHDDTVQRIGADQLFRFHRQHVAVEAGGGPHERLPQAHHREFEWEAT